MWKKHRYSHLVIHVTGLLLPIPTLLFWYNYWISWLISTCCFLHVIIAGKIVLEGKCSEITLFGTRFKYNLAILDTFEFKLWHSICCKANINDTSLSLMAASWSESHKSMTLDISVLQPANTNLWAKRWPIDYRQFCDWEEASGWWGNKDLLKPGWVRGCLTVNSQKNVTSKHWAQQRSTTIPIYAPLEFLLVHMIDMRLVLFVLVECPPCPHFEWTIWHFRQQGGEGRPYWVVNPVDVLISESWAIAMHKI